MTMRLPVRRGVGRSKNLMASGVQAARGAATQELPGALAHLYKTVLEAINRAAPLFGILESLCRFMEKQFPELLCSVLLMDAEGTSLRHGAAPSLPEEYNRAVDGLKIGPNAGSCGTAAHYRKQVVVADIARDPLWHGFSHLAVSHNLHACWSTPILSRAGKVLGTFAVYYREPRSPSSQHLHMVECCTHLAGIAIEREQSDAQLLAAETRFRNLVEKLPAITYVAEVGILGRWHYVSPQIQSILGFTPEQWLCNSSNWINHVHADDRDRVLAAEKRFWEIGGMFRAEYRMIARDGRILWFRDDATYLRTSDAQNPVMQGVLYDMTEHKQLEDQLRQSQKMEAIGKLAGGVAHDFNNLLMIIQGHSERLLQHLSSDHPALKDAGEIKEAVSRGASLTGQLLAFSRKQMLQPRVLDLNAVVSEIGKMLQRLIGESITVNLTMAPSLGRIKVDQGQLEQAILNLALNSRDAMPQGGQLTLETSSVELDEDHAREHECRPGGYVVLTVSDTGCGMDTETQSHIFEPFFTTKELGKGTGLGLATVYGLVQQSGGWISFHSRLGHGSTFSIYLPETSETPTVNPEENAPLLRTGGTETVLVVEDEDEIREIVSDYLQNQGYTVLHASDGKKALEIAHHYKGVIHLLVTDVVMPHLGGQELAQELKQVRPRTKVLFTSGYPEHICMQDAPGDPEVILQKPYPLSVLARRIRQVLDGQQYSCPSAELS
jgi:PAS domain S-box-containing protein